MLEQIHAPSEDGRKVKMMLCLATAAFGASASLGSGFALTAAGVVAAAVALAGLASAARRHSRA